jgi:ABC-2 type transport system ATP-binding protein
MSEIVVETKDLTKMYGSFVALERLTIHLERGQILGFIGPNGAGKTTTIKILVGLSRATSGEARIAGVDCQSDARKVKRLVGYMPDTFGAYDNMRVQEYLDFFGAAYKIPRKERLKRIETTMEMTGSTYMRDRFVDSLSHGMKQRVGIARTLLHDPPVLILDEPANGLDPTARVEMRQILLRLSEMGKTLIVTSHILPELSRICDTVAIMTKGVLRAFGPLDHIMRGIRQRRLIEIQLLDAKEVERVAGIVRTSVDPADEVVGAVEELTVRVRTMASDAALTDLLAKLVTQGVKVAQFREVQQDLEDAFLEVTKNERGGSGDRDAAPAASATAGT